MFAIVVNAETGFVGECGFEPTAFLEIGKGATAYTGCIEEVIVSMVAQGGNVAAAGAGDGNLLRLDKKCERVGLFFVGGGNR